jgi:hypothetical protein
MGLKESSKMPSSFETVIWTLLFIAFFPALWLFAAWLDRIWPSTSELDAKRKREKAHVEIAVPEE